MLHAVSLAKDESWRRTKWDIGNGTLKESVTQAQTVPEDVLDALGGGIVVVDASHVVFDADSIYVFLRYKGKCSRFAIYNPKFDSSKKAHDPVAASLKSLLRIAGMASG